MQPSSDQGSSSGSRQLRRWGPLVAIVAVLAVVAGVVIVAGGGDDDDEDTGQAAVNAEDPNEGALPFSVAEEDGIDVEWPETCDTDRGRVAIPFFFAPECYAPLDPETNPGPFDGENGGETHTGVTADTVRVVYYLGPESNPVIDFIREDFSDDTNAQRAETLQNFNEFFNEFFQTYGRRVELEIFTGTGPAEDEVAARADAITIAEDIQPFAVLGGPLLNDAFADELAARQIPCIGCTLAQPDEFYLDRAPYVYGITPNPQQSNIHTAEFIGTQLAGENAEFAGDETLHDQERVLGLVFLEFDEDAQAQVDDFEAQLQENDVELAVRVPYADPVSLQTTAANVIARLKDAGVTTVLFSGDPIAPRTLTQEATAQDYFPEWVVTATNQLADTTTFARSYDQEQWANAMGVTYLSARGDPNNQGYFFLHEWYTGEEPPADDEVLVLVPNMNLFYAALQNTGPDLTPENFNRSMFTLPSTREITEGESPLTQPTLSFGDRGVWPDLEADYLGIDDATAFWWDPEVSGLDERGDEGQGMYQYVDGGRRYLPGEWPSDQLVFFDPEESVPIYEERPPAEEVPEYPSPAG